MSKIQKSGYILTQASKFHRLLGKACYYCDLDQVSMKKGSHENMCVEYTYINNKPKAIFFTDWKYPEENSSITWRQSSLQLQASMATELKIPFFIIVTCLDPIEHPVKCYFVIPSNIVAVERFKEYGFPTEGRWMSLQSFSRFQHLLRNKIWNGEEQIMDENLIKCGLDTNMKLKDLPHQYRRYALPEIDIDALTQPEP